MHWLWFHAGLASGNSSWYLWWSGIVGDLALLGVVGALWTMVRKHNCHVHHCWRVGRHPVEGTPYVVCRKHHPDGHLSAEHVLQRHRIAEAWRHRKAGS